MLRLLMPPVLTIVVDGLAWAVFHAATGYAAYRLDDSRLSREGWLLRPRRFETGGRWYRRWLRIHRWKDRLPEAGGLFRGGVSKRHLPGVRPRRSAALRPRDPPGRAGPLVGDVLRTRVRGVEPAARSRAPRRLRGGGQPAVHPHPAVQPVPHQGADRAPWVALRGTAHAAMEGPSPRSGRPAPATVPSPSCSSPGRRSA